MKNVKKIKKIKRKPVSWALPLTILSLTVICILCASLIAWAGDSTYYMIMREAVDRTTYYAGIFIDGKDVSSLTYAEALDRWAEYDAQARSAHNVRLALRGETWEMDANSLAYESDYVEPLARAWMVGRYGSLAQRYETVRTLSDRNYAVERSYSMKKLKTLLEAIASANNVEAYAAQVKNFDPESGTFTFTEAKNGQMIDEDEIIGDVNNAIKRGGGTVDIALYEIDAQETAEKISSQYGLIASATTNASSSSKKRLTNLKVACRTISGMKIDVGETFSFNEALGKRTTEKGYKPAGAIENGITTDQVGGGICQISTTLFNAAVKADLSIVERSPHSRPSTYVDVGKDAAVNWPNQDFKFKNTSTEPVYIAATVTGKKRVVISIYGKLREDGVTIKLESKKTATISPGADRISYDASLPTGQSVVVEKARKGYKATTYKVYYDANEREIGREVLCKSSYPASGAIVRVGR